MNKLTVLINSCDNYSDIWDAFFKIFNKEWHDCPYPVVLNTESKSYRNIKTFNLYQSGSVIPWSKRLKETLKNIDSKYVLMILDDFFFTSKVNTNGIKQCVYYMDNDEKIACFYLYHLPSSHNNKKYKNFEIRDKECEYKLNCQAGIWRKDLLISFLRDHENPWQFETLGSKRAKRYDYDFYSISNDVEQYIPYDFHKYGLIRGKWFRDTKVLFNKYNIKIDYSIRGFYDKDIKEQQKTFFQTISPPNIYSYIKYLFNKLIVNIKSLH